MSSVPRVICNQKRWKPSASNESKRLLIDMHKGGICSSRTRGIRVDLSTITNNIINANANRDLGTTSNGDDGGDDECPPDTPPATPEDVKYTRVILETDPLKEQIERFMYCPKCQHPVEVAFPTTCIATRCRVSCTHCQWFNATKVAGTDVPLDENAGSPLIERNSDYAINMLYILGFMCSGDGGKEAERLLGLLGLPNSTTFVWNNYTTNKPTDSRPCRRDFVREPDNCSARVL